MRYVMNACELNIALPGLNGKKTSSQQAVFAKHECPQTATFSGMCVVIKHMHCQR